MTNTTNKRRRRMAREPKSDTATTPDQPKTPAVLSNDNVQPASPKRPNKTEAVLGLLRRTEGATLEELVTVTGWLPHTTRAAMTGLRKKGHQITRTKVDGISRYTVAGSAAQ